MKKIHTLLASLAWLMLGGVNSASAQTQTQTPACVPYSIPIQSTIVACGYGMSGSKYKVTTKTCPGGAITNSTEYDVSGCHMAPPTPGTINTSNRCAVTPDACSSAPTPSDCPSGSRWTLEGTQKAHCVAVDPACGWGTTLVHDVNGNPSCVANTCPSNKVLQPDGISCGCPAALPIWDGASCTAPALCTPSTSSTSVACSPLFFKAGTFYQAITTVTCPAGPFGAPVAAVTYDTSGCIPLAPTCTASSQTVGQLCANSTTYWQTRVKTTSCNSGANGPATITYGAWDTSACAAVPVACPANTTVGSNPTCGANETAVPNSKVTTTTYDCSGPTPVPTVTVTQPGTCMPNAYTCVASTVVNPASCPANTTGTATSTVQTICNNGPYGVPDVFPAVVDTSACVPLRIECTPSVVTNTAVACGTGFTGTKFTTTTTTCPSGQYVSGVTTISAYDTTACTPVPPLCIIKYFNGQTFYVYGWGAGSGTGPGTSPYNALTGLTGWNTCP